MVNRTGAKFCRRCRNAPTGHGISVTQPGDLQAKFSSLAGDFRRAPMFLNGSLYAVSTDGIVQTMSLRKGAIARALCNMNPAVAFNQAALVEVKPIGKAQAGWTYLGISPSMVEAFSLVTGQATVLYEAANNAEILVNATGSATRFRGVAANGQFYAFAEKAEAEQISLVLCYYSGDLPAERPLIINGTSAMGPVLSNDTLAFCSTEMVGVYDLRNQRSMQMPLPPRFVPLLARKQGGLSIPVGSTPLAVTRSRNELEVWIAGEEDGVPGLLTMNPDRRSSHFERLPRFTILSSNRDGTLVLTMENEVRIMGPAGWKMERLSLQSGMPAMFDNQFLLSFAEDGWNGQHNVTLSIPGRAKVATLSFDDAQCRPETCCGIGITANDVAVSYFEAAPRNGIKVAHWGLEAGTV